MTDARSQPQVFLPAIAPTRNSSVPTLENIPPGAQHERGALAAEWGRKLPASFSSQAAKTVHMHMKPVTQGLQSAHPSKLEAAVKEANGKNFMRTISNVRQCKSLPHLHRQALECALATHMVRARTELGFWQSGLRRIEKACQLRDTERLDAALADWSFTEDEPEVAAARAKLQRWRTTQQELRPVLRDAVKHKDIPALQEIVGRIDKDGPENVEGLAAARSLLKRYEICAKSLRHALAKGDTNAVEVAVKAWEFDKTDPLVVAGRKMRVNRERQLQELRALNTGNFPDGALLRKAVAAWDFESGNAELRRAQELLERFKLEDEQLKRLAQQAPGSFPQLRRAVATWSFASRSSSGNSGIQLANAALREHEEALVAAMDARDAWKFMRHWEAGGFAAALDRDSRLCEDATAFTSQHEQATVGIWEAVDDAPEFEAIAEPGVSKLTGEWAFASDDPAVELGREWLRLQSIVAERSKRELQAAAAVRSMQATQKALERSQGLHSDSSEVSQAGAIGTDYAAMSQATWAAGVVLVSDVGCEPEPGKLLAEQAFHSGAHGNHMLAAAWVACGGDRRELEKCVAEVRTSLCGPAEKSLREIEDAMAEFYAEDAPDSLLQRVEKCITSLRELPTQEVAAPQSRPLLEPLSRLVLGVGAGPRTPQDKVTASALVQAALKMLEAAAAELSQDRDSGDSGPAASSRLRVIVATETKIQFGEHEVPSGRITAAVGALNLLSGSGPLEEVVREFIAVVRSFFADFVPLRAARASAAAALADAQEVVQQAEEILALGSQVACLVGTPPVVHRQSDTLVALTHRIGSSQVPLPIGVALPALSVAYAQRIAAQSLASRLDVGQAPLPPSEDPGLRLAWVAATIEMALGPVSHFAAALAELAESICEKDLTELRSPGRRIEVLSSLIWLLWPDCKRNYGSQDASILPVSSKDLRSAIVAWRPVKDGIDTRLKSARALLQGCVPWFIDGCDGSEAARKVFAWAATAVSLANIIPQARELTAGHEAVAAAKARMDNGEVDAATAWKEVRRALDRPDEPSWWLRACGCTAAQCQDLYARYGLAPEKEAAGDVSGMPASPASEEAGAFGDLTRNEANKGSPSSQHVEKLTGSEEDSYGFEADKPGSKVGSVFSFGPDNAQKSPKQDPGDAEHDDDYCFEEEGNGNGGIGGTPKGQAGSPGYQRVFSFSGDQGDQEDGMGFEESFNEGDADPDAVLSAPPQEEAANAGTEENSSGQPSSVKHEFSFGGT